MKHCRSELRRETVAQAAKRRYPHLALPVGKALLLFADQPHKQWDVTVRHCHTPDPDVFAQIGHEALRVLNSAAVRLPLASIARFGPRHGMALAKHWVITGVRGTALKQRMAVLRYWSRWVGHPEAAPHLDDVVRELREEACHD